MSLTIEEVHIISSCDIDESLKAKIMNIYLASERRNKYNREYYRNNRDTILEKQREKYRNDKEELIRLRAIINENYLVC